MKFEEKLIDHIRTGYSPIIHINTELETEALMSTYNVLIDEGIVDVYVVSPSPLVGIKKMEAKSDGTAVLEDEVQQLDFGKFNNFINGKISNKDKFGIIIKDFQYLSNENRKNAGWELTLKSFAERVEMMPRNKRFPVILISNNLLASVEINYLIKTISFDLPDKEEIEAFLNAYSVNRNKELGDIKELSNTFLGFDLRGITETLDSMFLNNDSLNKEFISDKKLELMRANDILEVKTPSVSLDDIGGNEIFKEWVEEIRYCALPEARKYGIPLSNGYLAVGPAGSAKTCTAEGLAGSMNVPFIKINFSKILSKYAGQSEKNMARAMNLIKSCAPCVCLIDEVEKNLGGYASSNQSDSGAIARVFAIVLDFLMNNDCGVYVVMTSNDVSQLPPELTRAGRLDAIWYFAIPTRKERKEIFKIHLDKLNISIDNKLLNTIVDKTDGYTGAEIQQVVKASTRKAFAEFMRKNIDHYEVTEDILLESIDKVIPISVSSKEKVQALEAWAKGRALNASKKEEIDDSFFENIPPVN